MAQIGNAGTGQRQQLFEILVHIRAVRSEFLLNGREPHLQPDVGLDHAIVQVARNTSPLRFRSVRGQPVYQTDVVDGRHCLFEHLQEEIDIRSLKSIPPGGRKIEPSDSLTPVAYWYDDIRFGSQNFTDLL